MRINPVVRFSVLNISHGLVPFGDREAYITSL